MKTLLRFIKQWQLRRAREKYVAVKARRAVLLEANEGKMSYIWVRNREDEYANLCAEEAKLEERVESLMREQL